MRARHVWPGSRQRLRPLSVLSVVLIAGAAAVASGQNREIPVIRLLPTARTAPDAARATRPRATPLSEQEKVMRVRAVLPTRPQPEAPIRLDGATTTIPGRAVLYLRNGDLYGDRGWGIFLPREDSTLSLKARLDASKTYLLDCPVLNDNGGGTVKLDAGGQKTSITIGSQITHVTWVLAPSSADWYTVQLSATSITAGPYGRTVALEVDYCEITPFK